MVGHGHDFGWTYYTFSDDVSLFFWYRFYVCTNQQYTADESGPFQKTYNLNVIRCHSGRKEKCSA